MDPGRYGNANLHGKVALLTGGTSGIGLHAAICLAAAGAQVVVNGRSEAGGVAAIEKLAPICPTAEFEQGDCSDHARMEQVVSGVVKRHGGLDILISAGAEGAVGPKPFAEMNVVEIERAFTTRVFPRLFPVHAALPALRDRGGGSVVMVTTDAARHPTAGEAIIGSAGAAVILATKGLAKEFARWRIRVNTVALTITSGTPSWDRIFARESFQKKLFETALERFPFGRPPNADEVADVIGFLASEKAGQVTGQTVSINGGLSFGGW